MINSLDIDVHATGVSLSDVKVKFGDHKVLHGVDLQVAKGKTICIIGPSGSGKSTLLRCINLLENPSGGEILYNGNNILETKDIPNYRTKVGMVFQNFNLFENMNVLQNCMIGLQKVLKIDKNESKERALFFLEKVGMTPFINAKPKF